MPIGLQLLSMQYLRIKSWSVYDIEKLPLEFGAIIMLLQHLKIDKLLPDLRKRLLA